MGKKFVKATVFEWDDECKHQFTRQVYFNVDDIASVGYTWYGKMKNESMLTTMHDRKTYSILETPEEIANQIN